jgi:hypothetical protein
MLSLLAKYVINRLIHGLFHIALVISPGLISPLGLKPSGLISTIQLFSYISICKVKNYKRQDKNT